MPERRNSVKSSISTATKHKLATPLRRSPRFHHRDSRDVNTENSQPTKTHTKCSRKTPRARRKSDVGSLISENQVIGSRRSLRLSNRADGVPNLRRSSRLSLLGNNSGHGGSKKSTDIKSKKFKHSDSAKSEDNKGVLRNKVKWKNDMGSRNKSVQRSERRTKCCVDVSIVMGLEAVNKRDFLEKNQETRVVRKRKRGEEANKESVKGWTKQQEMALQRAYIMAKPTPNFWKQVSKLVPGKSAKDCFDKVHSDHMTPPQPLPRSRAKKTNSSPLGCFSLSASKLLGSSSVKVKSSRNKQKSHIGRKTVRQLVQKHNRMDLNDEADLFSILEPNVNSSRQDSEPNNIVSTPKQLQGKTGFLQKCHEKSLSGQKKTLSRFTNSSVTDLSSPPVLKQVKSRALHEKYIDQLHCREAKRKAACARAGKEKNGQANMPKRDMVRTAKSALVSDAIDAINKLQHLRTCTKGDSSDRDDDDDDIDNDSDDDS